MNKLRKLFNILIISVTGIKGNLLRTFLTTLGILIGIFAVVVMSMMAYSLQKTLMYQFTQMGSNVFWVQKWPMIMGGGNVNLREIWQWPDIKLEYLDLIYETAPAVKSIAPISYNRTDVESDREKAKGTLVLSSNHHLGTISGYELKEGRFLAPYEISSKRYVCVISQEIVDALFPFNQEPIGEIVKVGHFPFRIIGILDEHSGRPGRGGSNFLIIPYTTAQSVFRRTHRLTLTIEALEGRLEEAMDEVITTLRLERGLKWDEENNFSIITAEMIIDAMNRVTSIAYVVIVGITAISLIVAGIGIMNIMYVTVTERTKEIGIRKSCGATQSDILYQFGIESALISCIGGVLAIGLVYFSKLIFARFIPFDLILPLWVVLLGVAFSIFVGLVFGLFPAYGASKKDPVESLRYE